MVQLFTRLALAGLVVASPIAAHARAERPPIVKAQIPVRPDVREAQALPSLGPLVDSVKVAVVNVDVRAKAPPLEVGDLPDLFEDFFGRPIRPPGSDIREGTGSGFIIDPSGLVLTNNHVVQNALSIRVTLDDGRQFEGRVLGRDALTDVALVKLEGQPANLPVVTLGDSNATRVGDWVVAIGNPFGLASSVSAGIVSARERQIGAGPFDDFIQTDAAINPGNSGGPLFSIRGEVVGMTTAIVGGGSGIGFAVPSNLIKALLPALQRGQPVERGWLGITVQDLSADLGTALGVPASRGAVVVGLEDGTPAARAGVRPDDAIVALNGKPIQSAAELTRRVALEKPGSTAALSLFRGGRQQEVRVTLGRRPDVEGVRLHEPQEAPQQEKKLGLTFQDIDARLARERGMPAQGALVTNVAPGSPAERAELAPGMVVVEAARQPVKRAEDLRRILSQAKKGSVVLLRVQVPGGMMLRALPVPR